MQIIIDLRNYAVWYNILFLVLFAGLALLAWSRLLGWHEKGLLLVILAAWTIYSVAVLSHHLTGWPMIH